MQKARLPVFALLLAAGCSTMHPPSDEVSPKAEWKVTASALQEEIYPALYACDSRRETRWSSPPADPQWLRIDLGRITLVCGMTILWETAYASEYAIEVSCDGKRWTEVYANPHADGNTDYIYFPPVDARYLKVVGLKRATGWGYSIYEIDVHGRSEQITRTTREENGRVSVTLDLRRDLVLGGLRIEWGKTFSPDVDLFASMDGTNWTRTGEVRDSNGGFDVIMHPQTTARFLRLDMVNAAEIRDIVFRGPDEVMTPLALYQLAAEKARPGFYPDSLRKRQVFWTIVGSPDDNMESLLDEYGNLEPLPRGASVMPYVFADGKLFSAFDARTVVPALESGYLPLPSVTWDLDRLQLKIEAVTRDSVTYARYTMSNRSSQPQSGRLFLAVRPVQVNPPWQFGGLSHIRSLEFKHSTVTVNEKDRYVCLTQPDEFGARAFDRGDIINDLTKGVLPTVRQLDKAGELISGALAYAFDLKPGESKEVRLAVPLNGKVDKTASFDELWLEQKEKWARLVDRVVFELPDTNLVNTIKSHLAYVLVNRDGFAIQPGSRQYERSWIRDGALTSLSLLRFGLTNTVRDYIDWYAHFVQPDGAVPPSFRADDPLDCGPGSGLEYDGQGLFNYLVMEYYRFTGDRELLARQFDKMHGSMKFMAEIRQRTLVPGYMATNPPAERFAGIFPRSYSHEGYDPPMHSYWDDFWGLLGWKDGAQAARILGHDDVADWAESEYRALHESMKKSIAATMTAKKIGYMPGCAEKGDFDPSASTVALGPCGERDLAPDKVWRATFDRYYGDLLARRKPEWSAGFCPYEARIISAFVELGEKDRALYLLEYLMGFRRPAEWNHFGEVAYGDPRMASYIGDMPHTWAGSGIVNAAREMVIIEEGDRLCLLKGAPEKWLSDGRGIVLGKMPTWFGPLDFTARIVDGRFTAALGDLRAPGGYALYWPMANQPSRVTVDGNPWTDYDATQCRLPPGAHRVEAK